MEQTVSAIIPCTDLDASEAFYNRLGFTRDEGGYDDYRILHDGRGGSVHLNPAVEGWVVPGKNPFGLYLYIEDVDGLAEQVADIRINAPADRDWGMYEFALSDPDGVLVRVGWPTRLRTGA